MKIKTLTVIALLLLQNNSALADEKGIKDNLEAKGCGIITVYKKPPKTKNVHYAAINSIDGVVVSTKSRSFVLTTGKHVIKVIENIRENSLTRRRGEMKNFKYIEIDIQANKKYALGAKFIRKNRSKLKTGEYWQPVVWSESEESCKL